MAESFRSPKNEGRIEIEAGLKKLQASMNVPEDVRGFVIFVHGATGGLTDPRNQHVAIELRGRRIGTLLVSLITDDEKGDSPLDELEARFDLRTLTRRVLDVTQWVRRLEPVASLPLGYFAASTGAGAAVAAAAELGDPVRAIVSCDGRPDLAPEDSLARLQAPTLLIVGEGEPEAHFLNRRAFEALGAREKDLAIIPGGTDRLEGPGERDEVARLAADWFARHLAGVVEKKRAVTEKSTKGVPPTDAQAGERHRKRKAA